MPVPQLRQSRHHLGVVAADILFLGDIVFEIVEDRLGVFLARRRPAATLGDVHFPSRSAPPLDKPRNAYTLKSADAPANPIPMFIQAFHDLLKPQWLAALAELKTSGGLAVSELSRRLDSSYMTIKQHCESLTELGYLRRSRVPRTEIGRPEIFYRLSEKAEALFPSIPPAFTLGLLDQVRQTYGETAPEKLLFQYFQTQEEIWKARLSKAPNLLQKARLFAKVREEDGLFIRCIEEPDTGRIILREFHHPLREVFGKFPRVIAMEQRAIEAALSTRLVRQPVAGTGDIPSHIDFILPH